MAAPTDDPTVTPMRLLGEEEMLDEAKDQAEQIVNGRVAKRMKMTHDLYFEDERGLKKVLKTFPKLKFKGKGHEFEDLKVMLSNYSRWLKELYPSKDKFEDKVLMARIILQEKEKASDGIESDPRERLHLLRLGYKTSGLGGTKDPGPKPVTKELTAEAKARIAANRQKALELRKRRLEGGDALEDAQAPAAPLHQASQPGPPDMFPDYFPEPGGGTFVEEDEEDVFGFGGGLDDFDAQAPPPEPKKLPPVEAPAPAPKAALSDEARERIAQNRALALEKRRAAAAAQQQQGTEPAAPAQPSCANTCLDSTAVPTEMTLDQPTLPDSTCPPAATAVDSSARDSAVPPAATAVDSSAGVAATALDSAPATNALAAPAAATAVDSPASMADAIFEGEDEDVFGFGGGLDEP